MSSNEKNHGIMDYIEFYIETNIPEIKLAVFDSSNAGITDTKVTFNGSEVDGYSVSWTQGNSFKFTSEYLADAKDRGVSAVKVWIKTESGSYIYYTENGNAIKNSDWQCGASSWTAFNYGLKYGNGVTGNPSNSLFDNVLSLSELAGIEIFNANGSGTVTHEMYVEEFTDNYPIISGQDYTKQTGELADGSTGTYYKVDYTNTHLNNYDNRFEIKDYAAGFMISDAYLDALKKEGNTHIKIMIRGKNYINDGEGVYSNGNYIDAMLYNTRKTYEHTEASEVGNKMTTEFNETTWTEMRFTETSNVISIDDARTLRIFKQGCGLSSDYFIGVIDWFEFYVVPVSE